MYESFRPKPVAQVIDPSLSVEARSRLARKIKRSNNRVDDAVGGIGLLLCIPAAIILAILHFVIGLSWWWMFASVIPFVVGFALMFPLSGELADSDYSHFVEASDLDTSARQLMFRAQEAINGALRSDVYANNSFDKALEEPVLRRHEWDIAIALRKISNLRSELQASTQKLPGPMEAAVLASHRNALALATNSTTSRIDALERYAKELKMADDAERDWRAARRASGRNDQYIDLIAATAADEHAIAEIKGLTEQAAVAAQVFREQASLAAHSLVLPTARHE